MADIGKYEPTVTRRTRSISLRGVDYHVNEWGDEDAPLFVYLHGWADTGSTFQFVVDALKSEWRVVAPDWRGFGRTVHRSESYWFPDYLADLHALLDDYSPGVPARLVGHSMGANVAALFAGTMPERVAAMVNIEGFGLGDSNPNDAPQRYRDWLESAQATPEFSTYPDFESLAMRIRKRSPGLSERQADFVAREWAMEDSGVVRLRADPRHKLPNPVLYRRAEAEACWRNVRAEVLLISGDRSPFASQFGSTSDLPFPHKRSTMIKGVGHMIHFEAPQRLAEQIEQFLKQPL
jgi:pimeloyl-ACP methyl ester carboxylesterase